MTRAGLVYAGLGAAGLYLLWRHTAQAAQASLIQPGVMVSTFTAVPAVTADQVRQAQSFWSSLQPVQPLDSGYITFPSGSQVAVALMGGGNTAMDGNGNYYVLWAGQVYQLGSQDSAGNWPALPVSVS